MTVSKRLCDELRAFEASMRAQMRLQRIEIAVAVGLIFALDSILARLLECRMM